MRSSLAISSPAITSQVSVLFRRLLDRRPDAIGRHSLSIGAGLCTALVALSLMVPTLAEACSCLFVDKVSEPYVLRELCAADAVFVGEVESALQLRAGLQEFKVWPRATFKGQLDSPVFLLSAVGGECGYPFRVQGKYLIFATQQTDPRYLNASICGLTRTYDPGDNVLKILKSADNEADKACSEVASAARHLELVRERLSDREALEEQSNELIEQRERATEPP